jgi:hypothetical protein
MPICSQCVAGEYLKDDNSSCLACSDAISNCYLCYKDFADAAKVKCTGCENGKIVSADGANCEDSSSSTIIIVSAVVGGVVLLGAGNISLI